MQQTAVPVGARFLRRQSKVRRILKQLQLVHRIQAQHPRLLYRNEWLGGLPVFEIAGLRLVR